MVMQSLLDSLSRCFGAPGTNNPNGGPLGSSPLNNGDNNNDRDGGRGSQPNSPRKGEGNGSSPGGDDDGNHNSADAARRRASRVSLHDEEWDALFDHATAECAAGVGDSPPQTRRDGKARTRPAGGEPDEEMDEPSSAAAAAAAAAKVAAGAHTSSRTSTPKKKKVPPDVELGYAEVVAKARQAANPSRHRTPTKKKKSSGDRKADIFRSRANSDEANKTSGYSTSGGGAGSTSSRAGSFASRFLSSHEGVAKALCFANPIRSPSQEEEESNNDGIRSTDVSDANTLNTCEDTITSTLYFDAKYSHVVESRPPMPLFQQFKVDTDEGKQDELRKIVASDSHNSLNMIKLFQEQSLVGGSGTHYVMPNQQRSHVVTPPPGQQQQREFQQLPPVGVVTPGGGGGNNGGNGGHPAHDVQMISIDTSTDDDSDDDDGADDEQSSHSGGGESLFDDLDEQYQDHRRGQVRQGKHESQTRKSQRKQQQQTQRQTRKASRGRGRASPGTAPRSRHNSTSRASSLASNGSGASGGRSRRSKSKGANSRGTSSRASSTSRTSQSRGRGATSRASNASLGVTSSAGTVQIHHHASAAANSQYNGNTISPKYGTSPANSTSPSSVAVAATQLERELARRSQLEVISKTSHNNSSPAAVMHHLDNAADSVPPNIKLLTDSSRSQSTGPSTAPSTPTSSRSMSNEGPGGGGRATSKSRVGSGGQHHHQQTAGVVL